MGLLRSLYICFLKQHNFVYHAWMVMRCKHQYQMQAAHKVHKSCHARFYKMQELRVACRRWVLSRLDEVPNV